MEERNIKLQNELATRSVVTSEGRREIETYLNSGLLHSLVDNCTYL